MRTTRRRVDIFKGFPILSPAEFEKIDRSARKAINGCANLLVEFERRRTNRDGPCYMPLVSGDQDDNR